MNLIAWLNARPFCWAASIDGGLTWIALQAEDDDNSQEAIREASKRFMVDEKLWTVEEDPITSLKKRS